MYVYCNKNEFFGTLSGGFGFDRPQWFGETSIPEEWCKSAWSGLYQLVITSICFLSSTNIDWTGLYQVHEVTVFLFCSQFNSFCWWLCNYHYLPSTTSSLDQDSLLS